MHTAEKIPSINFAALTRYSLRGALDWALSPSAPPDCRKQVHNIRLLATARAAAIWRRIINAKLFVAHACSGSRWNVRDHQGHEVGSPRDIVVVENRGACYDRDVRRNGEEQSTTMLGTTRGRAPVRV